MNSGVKAVAIFSNICALIAMIKSTCFARLADIAKPKYCFQYFLPRALVMVEEQARHSQLSVHLRAVFLEPDPFNRGCGEGGETALLVSDFKCLHLLISAKGQNS